jgi:UDP-glucose 4-epimerase
MSKKRVLVVGGAGYIGSHVCQALLTAGHQPVVFDNLSTGHKENILPGSEFIEGDILDGPALEAATANIDAVIHLAALKAAGESMTDPGRFATQNLSGSVNLLNACVNANIRSFVFSSSAAVYGEPKYVPMNESHPTAPMNFYGHTKLAIEGLLQWYSQLKSMRFASLRYFNAAGYDPTGKIKGLEKEPGNLMPIVMEVVMGTREKVVVFGDDYDTDDGTCIRDYIHVTDLAQAHVQALEHIASQDEDLVLNLGTSNGISVLEILEATKKLSGVDFKVEIGPRRAGDPAVVLADASLAKDVLGWVPKHSNVETLVKSMLDTYRNQ